MRKVTISPEQYAEYRELKKNRDSEVSSAGWLSDLPPEQRADLGCRMSRCVYRRCKDAPHDIGITLMHIIEGFLRDNVRAERPERRKSK